MFSIICPMDTNRLEQFAVTKELYDTFEQKKEFIIPTRSKSEVEKYLKEHKLMKNVRLIPYEHKLGFNPSKALNMGAREAKYDQLIITSPEVRPKTAVLDQLEELIGTNVVCRVWDEDESRKVEASLVHQGYRDESPAMYFLAMFNKKDVETINGWDEEFMKGYAYEDNDFGARWNRAGLPFVVREDIEGVHQYHPRGVTIPNGVQINEAKYAENNEKGIVYCEKGIKQ